MRRMRSTAGFTLLELLVALAILSGMVAMLYGGLFAVYRATDGVERSLTRLHEVRTALDVMRREIEASEPAKDNDPKPSITLVGKDYYGAPGTDCSFITFRSATGGTLAVRYYVAENTDRKLSLYKRVWRPWLGEDKAEEAELIDNISGFLVEVKNGDKWTSTWDGQNASEIRITLIVHAMDEDLTLIETARPAIGGAL